MAESPLKGKYFVKKGTGKYEDIYVKFPQVEVYMVSGLNEIGEAKNVYKKEWTNSDVDDIIEPTNGIKRKTVDVEITFIVTDRYANIDVKANHDAFVNYMLSGNVWFKSTYLNESNELAPLYGYKPATVTLNRPSGTNYIMGTLKLAKVKSKNTPT